MPTGGKPEVTGMERHAGRYQPHTFVTSRVKEPLNLWSVLRYRIARSPSVNTAGRLGEQFSGGNMPDAISRVQPSLLNDLSSFSNVSDFPQTADSITPKYSQDH